MEFEYINRIKKLIDDISTKEEKNILNATSLFYETIKNEKSIYVFGASHASIVTQELFYRAGGLILINPIFAEGANLNVSPISHTSEMERLEGYGRLLARKVNFKKGDLLLLHSVSGRNPITIEMAMEAKEKGCKIIIITNLNYSKSTTSRHSSKKLLFELGDIVIDNCGDIEDASIKIANIEQKVGPTSTISSCLIVNTIIVELTKKMKEDKDIPIFYSANIDGGDEKNKIIFEKFKNNIHYRL